MSTARQDVKLPTGEFSVGQEADLSDFEVFVQLTRKKALEHVGTVCAKDKSMALRFACEHYGRDQPCYRVWVVPRDAVAAACAESEVIWRLSDQSYREARGYHVAEKWRKVRSNKDYEQYRKEDLPDT